MSQLKAAAWESILITAAIYASLNVPPSLQNKLPEHLLSALPATAKFMKAILGLNLLRRTNNALSESAINAPKGDSTWNWAEELVVVTGGSSGIGECVVQKLANKGVKVIILDLQPPKTPQGPKVIFFKTDVTSSADIEKTANEIRSLHGDPTVLVNNAGVGYGATLLEESEANIRTTFNVNTIAHFLLLKQFLPSMIKKNHGHIVTMASMASFVTIAQNIDYSCTKAAAVAFHEGLRQELKHRYNASKVRTSYQKYLRQSALTCDQSIIHPSWVRTPLNEKLQGGENFPKKLLSPEEVADAILRQLLSGRGGQVILPTHLSFIRGIRAFPEWLQERIRDTGARILSNPA